MKILILGGDGFCGWPTALHLSAVGHDVTIIDDLSRRRIMKDLGAESLTPIASPQDRVAAWRNLTGKDIAFVHLDATADFDGLRSYVATCDAVVHLAEQSSAPWSMKSPRHRQYTVSRNLAATTNLISATLGTDVAIVHLGTMGVYGYGTAGKPLPEGWIEIEGRPALHPFFPGSIYHATKCMDATLIEFCCRNDGLRATDLHQGIVWGTQTEETAKDPRLINSFSWDGDYGTVLNRFLMQAAIGHPLTVHGTGGQTRAFIHVSDSVRCIRMAVENPPERGEYRVFNQVAECHRVRDLAVKVSNMTGAEISFVDNPRKEAAANELDVDNAGLRSLGWDPVTLDEKLMDDVVAIAGAHADRTRREAIACVSRW